MPPHLPAVRLLRCLIVLCAVLLGVGERAGAQRLQFRHLGVDDGLPSSLITDIVQDRRGFMWIGSAHGVTRYDGYHFRTYGHDPANPYSLPQDFVDQVYEDRLGTLWVVTSEGLSRYDATRDGFVTYLRPDAAVGQGTTARRLVSAVLDDRRGILWVGTGLGLYRFDRQTEAATPFPLAAGATPFVERLYEDRRGTVWVATNQGLYRIDDGRPARRYAYAPVDPRGLPDSAIKCVAEDARGDLWIGMGAGGLARLDVRTDRFTRFRHALTDPHSLAGDHVARLVPDRAGGMWVGTENGGLDYYDGATGQFVHHRFDPNVPSGISSNSIWSLYQDAAGALWVGSYSGGVDVSTPNGGAIEHYRTVPGDSGSLSYNAVPHFAEGRDGSIWVATDGGGVNRLDPVTGRFTHYTSRNTNLNGDAVVGVTVGRRGDVWVATWGGGISEFDAVRRRFTAYTLRNSNIPDGNVFELMEDRAGQLWIGADNGVVARFDRARRTFTRRYAVGPPGRAPSTVQVLRELRDGRFAVGLRENGLTILDPTTGRQTAYLAGPGRGGLAGNNVRTIEEVVPGVLWIGTDYGVDRLVVRSGRVTHFGEADGLASRFVDGIAADGAGRLWISTDRGLSRLDPRTRTVKTYTRSDGLQGNEFLARSVLRARNGTLYFGGNRGFNAIRPDRMMESTRPPPVAFTELQLFNRPVHVGAPGSPLARTIDRVDRLVLDHTQNVVTFEFAALDFTAPEKNHYAYRMDGFDAGWQDVGPQHSASYTNLAPGRYTFRVKASNGDGVWNEAGASLRLVIMPPTWQTWWFRLLAGATAAYGAFVLWRFQQRRRLEVALGRQALRDPLTGLANRTLFRDRVGHALARLARSGPAPAGEGARVAVLFLDLDGFKAVNDSFGHGAGDRLLHAVGARLLNATRGCDTVARFGGDEFAVLLENARGAADAVAVAERIVASLRAPIAIGDGDAPVAPDPHARTRQGMRPNDAASHAPAREARVGVSIGIAFADPAMDTDALLRNADAAMYKAKADGKGQYAVFDPALVAAAADRLALETELARALAHGMRAASSRATFALAYQPIVALDSGAVRSVEALVRWHHPTRGLVPPLEFIPLAEASGLIVELGRWVLAEACRAAAGWPPGADGLPVGITVNVSGRQLQDAALPGHVIGALAASGLDAERLTLEITESVLMRDTGASLAALRALKTLGVRLAVDDFGTGYSSLRYLQRFPVDVLKIDKSFVDGIARGGGPSEGHDAALARTIVALGEMLALGTVAEGVETEAQRDALRAMGCELGQGYLFARPLDEAGVREALEAGVRR